MSDSRLGLNDAISVACMEYGMRADVAAVLFDSLTIGGFEEVDEQQFRELCQKELEG